MIEFDKIFENFRNFRFYKRPWPKAEAGRSRAGAVNLGLGLKFPSLGRPEPGQAEPIKSLHERITRYVLIQGGRGSVQEVRV